MSMKETEIQKRAMELGKESAFPTSSLETAFGYTGLTKREYFAAVAMQSFVATNYANGHRTVIANESIKQAEALLIALEESEVHNG